jgi:hypothetical protein
LRATPPDSARLLGSPGFLYASTATHAWKWARAVVHRERARAAHHEHRVGYLVTYMWRSAILSYRQGDPLVREAAAFAVSHLRRRAGLVNMSAARLVLAHAVVAIILAGAAYDITTGREHWPFSPYPMFSTVERASTLDSLMLTGVTADGVAREMTLRDPSSIGPFDQCRLNTALERAASSDDGGARLHAMLEDCLTRYEAERQSGAHDGPPLRAMRVYGAHWTLDRDAKNVETPDTRRLLDEAVVAGASH